MPTETIQVSDLIPASPEAIYRAWLDGAQHSAMTGGRASCDASPGGSFTAWDGYISGRNLTLEPGRKIVQSWRSTEFPAGAGDSRIEVVLEPAAGGTRITLVHSEIPEGQGSQYQQGWADHYFTPMKAFFGGGATGGGERKAAPARKPAKRKAAQRKAPKRKAAGRKVARRKAPQKRAVRKPGRAKQVRRRR